MHCAFRSPVAISTIVGGFQDRPHAHRQRLARHLRRIAAEQRGVVAPGAVRQRHAVRARDELVARLVEADVAVGADAEQLEIDAARRLDRRFVALAFGVEIGAPRRSGSESATGRG